MELFKENIKIDSWGVVFLGLKKEWLIKSQVYEYCNAGLIVCSEEQLVELYVVENEPLLEFYELIKGWITDDGHEAINWNEDSNQWQWDKIPSQYYKFWEIETLQRTIFSSDEKSKTLNQVAALFGDFGYLEEWKLFLNNHIIPEGSTPIGIEGLYNNLIEYVDSEKARLKLSCL